MIVEDESLWYRPEAMPAGRLHVLVYWHVHGIPERLRVVRDWVRARRAWQWYMVAGRDELVPIPPRGRGGDGWADEPYCWQPFDADRWVWPGEAPQPLPVHAVPRFVSGPKLRYSAVDDTTETDDAEGSTMWLGELPWWRDPSEIRYEPPGEISRRHAEGRLMRALAHSGALTPRLRTTTTATLLARLADHAERAAQDAEDARVAAVRLARFAPLQSDHGDFLTAMSWFAALDQPGRRTVQTAWSLNRVQRVLHYRSMDKALTFSAIAYAVSSPRDRISWQAARQTYEDGIDRVWKIANRRSARGAA